MDEPRGSGVLRHQSLHDGFVAAQGPRQGFAEAIDRHIEEHFGPVEFVYHEIASHLVGVHVYVVGPTEERPYRTLITSGMSDLPMTVPDGHDISRYAELMLSLPADWPLTEVTGLNEEPTGWPVRLIKEIARLPHEYGSWIGEWHSVPNGDPAQPYATGTPFAGVVVTPMLRVPAEARAIEVPDGSRIELLALIPLHPDEVAVKIERGTNALIEILDRGRVTELLDPDRPSYA
ncbi:suppressor of fused domain protein [Micromonospora musae]|uniref:Suppressor of fused domain protein n=1 Tax=Micromonospora musae TaxID=1894970 RepID=A0A3A9XQA7_9ACTN|nr:suppressor of fused domain protein [Micromonospora musae]RKN16555.1 suppressor of fused domain protein [Micromonospora musae]RKN27318.1 suppressor of fused domain protein [Micromonospora musae]